MAERKGEAALHPVEPKRRRTWRRSAVFQLGISLLVLWAPAVTVAEGTVDEETLIFDQLGAREQILDMQRQTAEAGTRKRALFAYRMARRRELGFTSEPENRLGDARAFDLAIVALRRSADETSALTQELDRVRADRTTMESALIARALAAAEKADPRAESAATRVLLVRPLRGTPVALPGVRRDGPTKVELRHDSVDLLVRMNDPVRAVAAGVVKRIELLPQGGFAVVTAHADGLVSIVSGLRDVTVAPKAQVEAGQPLGLAGRNLDGAAVVSVEIWRNRRPQDAAKLLHVRLGG
jgi:murein DD-endopeptidase MepM/ murein hydrolase activator NlpD